MAQQKAPRGKKTGKKESATAASSRDIAAQLMARLDAPAKGSRGAQAGAKKQTGKSAGSWQGKPAGAGKSAEARQGKAASTGKSYGKDSGSAYSSNKQGKAAGKTAGKAAGKTVGKTAGKVAGKTAAASAGKPAAASKATGKQVSKPASKKAHKSDSASAGKSKQDPQSPCAVDAQCGGCSCIAEPYEEQLARKMGQMRALFSQVDGFFEVRQILGMQDPYHYRNKIVSPFAPGKKFKRPNAEDAETKKRRSRALEYEVLTGMYAEGTHRLIPTNECLIENPVGKQVIQAVAGMMAKYGIAPYNEDTGEGFMRHVVVRVGHQSGEVLVTLVTNEQTFPSSKSFCRELMAAVPQVTTVVQNINDRFTNVILGDAEQVLYGPGFILDTLCGLSFRISSTSFYQVNAGQTEVLYNAAMDLAQLSGTETAIDAYCGTGTIGLVAATHGAKRVIGVESVPAAVRDAQENARHNNIANALFQCADATQFMLDLAEESEDFDPQNTVLFMDPPRAGSTPEFLRAAAKLGPARIVYVSCNPQTQVRDIEVLQECGYDLRIVQPVDMFPHTDHVETVVLLEKQA